jgi:hypothetical protein
MVRAIVLCLCLLECSCIPTDTKEVITAPLSEHNATATLIAPLSMNEVMLVSLEEPEPLRLPKGGKRRELVAQVEARLTLEN